MASSIHNNDPIPHSFLIVGPETPMPEGYVYIPDHDPATTSRAQNLTFASGQLLYFVVIKKEDDPIGRKLGLRVPEDVAYDVFYNLEIPADNNAAAEYAAELENCIEATLEMYFAPEQHPDEWYTHLPPSAFTWDNEDEANEDEANGDEANEDEAVPEFEHSPEWDHYEPPSSFVWDTQEH